MIHSLITNGTMVRLTNFLLIIFLLSLPTLETYSQNTNHWQKINHGQVGTYDEGPWRVQYFSADTVFILGSDFYYSRNGASTFQTAQMSGNELNFNFPSARVGYIVGLAGTLKKTVDGGANWATLTPPTSQDLWGVDFITPETGIVVGVSGRIYRTSDGGNNWTQIPSGFSDYLFSVKWITPQIVLVGGAGTMLRSTDAGNTFSTVTSFNSFGWIYDIEYYDPEFSHIGNPQSVSQFDEHVILATGGFQNLIRSTDYGQTWANTLPTVPNPSLGSNFNEVAIIDNKRALTVGTNSQYGPSLWESADGGKSWQPYSVPTDYIPLSFDFYDHYTLIGMPRQTANTQRYFLKFDYQDPDVVILTPDMDGFQFTNKQKIPVTWRSNNINQISLQYSTDGGSSWLPITTVQATNQVYEWEIPETPGTQCYLKAVNAANTNVFDITDHSFAILTEFWQMHSTPTNNDLLATAYASPSIAFSGGRNGLLLKSTDSAKTWFKIPVNVASDVTTLSFLNESTGYLGTSHGQILKTENSGLTWNQLTGLDTTKFIKKIIAIDAFKALLLHAASNKLYLTNNGGVTWEVAETAVTDTINDIDYISGTGYAVGNHGLVLKSSNNFYSWVPLPSFTGADLWKVSFGAKNVGYVSTRTSNGIFITTDGFLSQTLKAFPVEKAVMDLKSTAPSTSFILLQDGYIYSTDDFGSTWQNQNPRFHNTLPANLRSFSFLKASLLFRGTAGFAAGDLGYLYRRSFGVPQHNLRFYQQAPRYDYIARMDTIRFKWEGSGISTVDIYATNVVKNTRMLISQGQSLQTEEFVLPITQQHMGKIRFELQSGSDVSLLTVGDSVYRVPAIVMDTLDNVNAIEQRFDMTDPTHGTLISKVRRFNGTQFDTLLIRYETDELLGWIKKNEYPLFNADQVSVSAASNSRRILIEKDGFFFTMKRTDNGGVSYVVLGDHTILPFQSGYRYPALRWHTADLGLWNKNGISRTTDGGTTWEAAVYQNYSSTPNIVAAEFINATSARARTRDGEMFFSNDAGATWEKYDEDTDSTFFFQAIDQDNMVAVRVTENKKWEVRTSSNGGSDWQQKSMLDPLTDGTNYDHIPLYFVTDSTGIVVTRKYQLLLTDDAGTTWAPLNNPDTNLTKALYVTGRNKVEQPFMAATLRDGRVLVFHSYFLTPVSSVDDECPALEMPSEYTLSQNYPNPFNPSTKIDFTLASAGRVTLKVYDILGSEVATLLQENLPAGKHSTVFNAAGLPSGIYFCTLRSNNVQITRKMTLIK